MDEDVKLEDYFDLVHRLAAPYAIASNCVEIRNSDAYAEGLLCLVKAKRKFDPTRNVKFITYAYHVIQHGLSAWWKKNKPIQSTPEWKHVVAPLKERREFEEEDIEYLRSLVNEFPIQSENRFIFEKRLQGTKLEDIADLLSCTKQNVDRILKRRIFPILLEKMEKRNETRTRSDLDKQNW